MTITEEVIEYAQNHIHKEFTVKEVAEALGRKGGWTSANLRGLAVSPSSIAGRHLEYVRRGVYRGIHEGRPTDLEAARALAAAHVEDARVEMIAATSMATLSRQSDQRPMWWVLQNVEYAKIGHRYALGNLRHIDDIIEEAASRRLLKFLEYSGDCQAAADSDRGRGALGHSCWCGVALEES